MIPSLTTPDVRAPSAPVLGAPTGVSTTSMTIPLTTPSTDVGGSGVATGLRQRALNAAFTSGVVTDASGALPLSRTSSGLASETTYFYREQYTDGAGNIGAFSNTVSATTQAVSDTTPDTFTFADQTGVALSTLIVSAPITISGINAPAPISVTGGEYSIDGSAFTSAAGTVLNSQQVRVRHTSGATNSASVNTTLTIGGVSDTFTSTTAGVGGAVHDITGLPLDANGFHDFQAIVNGNAAYASARFVYVDPVSGNDSTATVYSRGAFANMFNPGTVNAYATVAAANAQRRANQCDVILLRRGRTFTSLPSLSFSGVSSAARSIVAAYGTGARPAFPNLTGYCGDTRFAIIADLNITNTGNGADTTGLTLYPFPGPVSNVLVENCYFQGHSKGMVAENREADTNALNNVVLRRNIFYRNVGQLNSFNSTGIYNRRNDNATLDQNIWIENGWDGVNAATKDIQSRHVYVDDCRLMLFRENVCIRPASEQIQFRANLQGPGAERRDQGTMQNNLFLDGGLHVLLAENDGDVQMRFIENVCQGTLTTNPIGYAGRSVQFEGATNAVMDRNIFLNSDAVGQGFPLFAQALSFWQGVNSNIQITNNYFNQAGLLDFIGNGPTLSSITVSGNRVSITSGNLVEHQGSAVSFVNNQFFGGDSAPFRFAGVDRTLAAWQSAVPQATGNTHSASPLPASLTIESYLSAQGLTATLSAYMTALLAQDRTSWDSRLTASAANNWFRAQVGGFGSSGTPVGGKTVDVYAYLNSLHNHDAGPDSVNTSTANWIARLAPSAPSGGNVYTCGWMFGFANAWTTPPNAQGQEVVTSPHMSGTSWVGGTQIEVVEFVPDNFEGPFYDPSAVSNFGFAYTPRLLQLIDAWQATVPNPNRRYAIYGGWPDMGPYGQPGSITPTQITNYRNWALGGYQTWLETLVAQLRAARPALDIRLHNVNKATILAWRDTVVSTIATSALFEDDAPHGTSTWYFLAAIADYIELYDEKPPAGFVFNGAWNVHPTVTANYQSIVDYIWSVLRP